MAKRKREPSPAELLSRVAAALTACERAGVQVKLRHGVVITRRGYVLPIGSRWAARTLTYTPFRPADDEDDD